MFQDKERTTKVQHFASLITLIIGMIVLVYFLFIILAPMSYWVYYEDIIPAEDMFKVDEQIEFISVSEVKRSVDIKWTDVLFCRDDQIPDVFVFTASYASEAYAQKRELGDRYWLYNGTVVHEPTECYLDSTIEITLPWGLKKRQTIITDTFKIVE